MSNSFANQVVADSSVLNSRLTTLLKIYVAILGVTYTSSIVSMLVLEDTVVCLSCIFFC